MSPSLICIFRIQSAIVINIKYIIIIIIERMKKANALLAHRHERRPHDTA